MDFSNSLDADIRGFLQYYTKNFAIPSHVCIYGTEIEQSRGAGDKLLSSQCSAMASAHLNTQLLERVKRLQAISRRHEQLLARVRKAKENGKLLEEAKRLLEQLRAEVASVIFSDGLSPTETWLNSHFPTTFLPYFLFLLPPVLDYPFLLTTWSVTSYHFQTDLLVLPYFIYDNFLSSSLVKFSTVFYCHSIFIIYIRLLGVKNFL